MSTKLKSQLGLIFLILLVSVPTFFRMLRFGIYPMHDFHIFRLYEFNLCIKDLVFPCRWAPDAGFGYGEPLFNFYSPLSYFIGEPFVLLGLSIINSTKIAFIISLVGSAISMYFLSFHLWKNKLAGLLSAVLYVYAPYRAVDAWVRGALPESLAFVFFPFVLLTVEKYFSHKKTFYLILFSLALAALLLTHNLSFLMFLPVFGIFLI